ncbi:MAG: polyphosphate polymerase domain-containing protein [Blastocatellia bacterium]|nr:polyphosphate polymerase domain-containing protein [Blastocatellia bacterium]
MLRYEYKYFVPYARLGKVRMLLAPFMELDPYAREEGGEYTVRSIYFDTPDLECYFQKVSGVKRRNKVRLRGYNGGDARSRVFFEIKKKMDDPLLKHRAALTYEEAQQVLQGRPLEELDLAANNEADAYQEARRFLYHLHARRMRPVVTIIYEREPYQPFFPDEENDLRITLDKNLRTVAWPSLESLFVETDSRHVRPMHFILEVKFNRQLPGWVKSVLSSLGLAREAASKYALCLESHPDISTGRRRGVISNA